MIQVVMIPAARVPVQLNLQKRRARTQSSAKITILTTRMTTRLLLTLRWHSDRRLPECRRPTKDIPEKRLNRRAPRPPRHRVRWRFDQTDQSCSVTASMSFWLRGRSYGAGCSTSTLTLSTGGTVLRRALPWSWWRGVSYRETAAHWSCFKSLDGAAPVNVQNFTI